MTQQYLLASMAAQLSSTGISHHSLLPHTPSIHLSTVNSSPHPGTAPQSLSSSSYLLCLLGYLHPCQGYVWLWQGLSDSHSICVCVCVLVAQSCPTLCDSMDYSPPGSSAHGILQARILEWVAIIFSRGSSQPGIEPGSPALQADVLPSELLGKSSLHLGCHRSAVSLLTLNVSPLTQTTAPLWG